ncbi:GNAT family N-acetyltransferase [Pseudemcibacter aquimaris]|uniref:GNAT family N-acetyltransferase n=1 Tax=Pseudemcibacter aquimaris TaxID=2857064 RepID=UPI00201128BA|nr:N-acetyltransferase [Pseudemcibacter aquimaris]MCC3860402.1 N-acetyltransferase [Pseudemcibacter aquimaris]WDU57728.1 N-acetyltransferase [Pseudemcibacter aquimaris]
MKIRKEEIQDHVLVEDILKMAFESDGEARLVKALRDQASPIISLVAENDECAIVGQIMFTPVTIDGCEDVKIMGLAPVSVTPEEQGKGYGGALIKAGLHECRKLGMDGVVLLGHPDYYPKFGFKTSTEYDLACEYDVPAEAFMAMELSAGAFDKVSGTVKYHKVFSEL